MTSSFLGMCCSNCFTHQFCRYVLTDWNFLHLRNQQEHSCYRANSSINLFSTTSCEILQIEWLLQGKKKRKIKSICFHIYYNFTIELLTFVIASNKKNEDFLVVTFNLGLQCLLWGTKGNYLKINYVLFELLSTYI